MHKDPREIIHGLYKDNRVAMNILLAHSEAVAQKAIRVAESVPHLGADLRFIEETALLHDIGMIMTDAPMLGCHGKLPYICHGVEGRSILEAQGLADHALVCERHVGVGLTVKDIHDNGFPLPERDMIPLSIEEKIVCFADKFFSKLGDINEKPVVEVRASIARYGVEKIKVFDSMLDIFTASSLEHDT